MEVGVTQKQVGHASILMMLEVALVRRLRLQQSFRSGCGSSGGYIGGGGDITVDGWRRW